VTSLACNAIIMTSSTKRPFGMPTERTLASLPVAIVAVHLISTHAFATVHGSDWPACALLLRAGRQGLYMPCTPSDCLLALVHSRHAQTESNQSSAGNPHSTSGTYLGACYMPE
jgi:hypothetical protein